MYIIDRSSTNSRIRDNRSDDLRRLENHTQHNPDPAARAEAEKAIYSIQHEDKHVKAMREDLVKAHRSGDVQRVKEIQIEVQENKKYQSK